MRGQEGRGGNIPVMQIHANVRWIEAPARPNRLERLLERLRSFLGRQDPSLPEEFELWRQRRVLYAYVHPREGKVLYVGKAWGASVSQRFDAKDKARVRKAIWRAHSIHLEQVQVIVGFVEPVAQRAVTRKLIEEIESLLIYHVIPCGNTQHRESYHCRDGLTIRCLDAWPLRQQTFVDEVIQDELACT